MVYLADNVSGVGTLNELKDRWGIIISGGQKISYYVDESKSWLISKDSYKLEIAKQIFQNSNVKFTSETKRCLEAALRTDEFKLLM